MVGLRCSAEEVLVQRHARPVQFAFHRADRQAGHHADLLVAQVLEVAQREQQALLFVERGERLLHVALGLIAFD